MANGENLDDQIFESKNEPHIWPAVSALVSPPSKPAGKGILLSRGFRYV